MDDLADLALSGNDGKANDNRGLDIDFQSREQMGPPMSRNLEANYPGQLNQPGSSKGAPGGMPLPLGKQKDKPGRIE